MAITVDHTGTAAITLAASGGASTSALGINDNTFEISGVIEAVIGTTASPDVIFTIQQSSDGSVYGDNDSVATVYAVIPSNSATTLRVPFGPVPYLANDAKFRLIDDSGSAVVTANIDYSIRYTT